MGMRVDGSEFRAGRIFLLMVHLEAATNELQIIPLASELLALAANCGSLRHMQCN